MEELKNIKVVTYDCGDDFRLEVAIEDDCYEAHIYRNHTGDKIFAASMFSHSFKPTDYHEFINEIEKSIESRKYFYKERYRPTIENKRTYIANMDDRTYRAGLIKINIPEYDKRYETDGEEMWAYVEPDDKELCDGNYAGRITAILCGEPLTYDKLHMFDEVKLVCNGEHRPTIDPDWIEEVMA